MTTLSATLLCLLLQQVPRNEHALQLLEAQLGKNGKQGGRHGTLEDEAHVVESQTRDDRFPETATTDEGDNSCTSFSYVLLVDAELVAEAARQGIGAEMTPLLGGNLDRRFSQPISVTVQVAGLFDARFVLNGHLARNMPINMGPSAVLRAGNVFIVVTSTSGPHFAPELFQAAGLDPFTASVLVAKSPCGFRAAYAAQAREILVARAPGCAPSDFWRYEYQHIPRPLWPWDSIEDWIPSPSP